MVNIRFGQYSPPEKNGGRTSKTAHLSIGVFCDDTLNNKTNTESRIQERHCEELATKQSPATKNRLPRYARNDG
ncbi:MAG: hypothetical protein ACK5IQ_06975 [Bacteroidales bacterium]